MGSSPTYLQMLKLTKTEDVLNTRKEPYNQLLIFSLELIKLREMSFLQISSSVIQWLSYL